MLTDNTQMGFCPEDFPILGLQADDVIRFRLVQTNGSVPESEVIVARNVHSGDLAIGYIEGDTLHLAQESIRRYADWGAEVIGIVADIYRRIDRPAVPTRDRM